MLSYFLSDRSLYVFTLFSHSIFSYSTLFISQSSFYCCCVFLLLSIFFSTFLHSLFTLCLHFSQFTFHVTTYLCYFSFLKFYFLSSLSLHFLSPLSLYFIIIFSHSTFLFDNSTFSFYLTSEKLTFCGGQNFWNSWEKSQKPSGKIVRTTKIRLLPHGCLEYFPMARNHGEWAKFFPGFTQNHP